MPVEDIIVRFRMNMGDFNKTMAMSLDNMKRMNKANVTLRSTGARAANSIRKFTHGLRGFRMEMLGVMFFGMGLQKFFTGLLQPALKLTGIFELWSSVLQILFLPIALLLLDFLMPLFDWFMNLSEGTKLMIGKFVLFGAAIGAILFLFGMFALGIGSVILAFGGLFLILDKLIPDVSFLGTNISSFIEAGLGIALITTAARMLKNTLTDLFIKFIQLDFVQDLFEALGIDIENTSPTIQDFFDKVKKTMDILKEAVTDLFEEWNKKLDELDIDNLTDSVIKLSDSIIKMTPAVEKFANFLSSIAKSINQISAIPAITGAIFTGKFDEAERLRVEAGGAPEPTTQNLTFNPVINVTSTGGFDINKVKLELNELWARNLSDLNRGR